MKNKKYTNYNILIIKYIVIYILILCVGFYSFLLIKSGISSNKEHIFKYNDTINANYDVVLKENPHFDEKEYKNDDNKYIASLINEINIAYEYAFDSSDFISGKYSYNITAELQAKEKNKEAIIWSKKETIFESDSSNIDNSNNFTFGKTVTINYMKYNSIMQEFRSAYNVALDANLIVTLNVTDELNHNYSEEAINVSSFNSVTIPLLDQTIEIFSDKTNNDKTLTLNEKVNRNKDNYIKLGIGCFLLIICFILSIMVLKKIYVIYVNRDKYIQNIRKIFKNYEEIIVRVKKLPNVDDKILLELEKFDDLLDTQNELKEPILFKEMKKSKTCVFMIVKDDRAFVYYESFKNNL